MNREQKNKKIKVCGCVWLVLFSLNHSHPLALLKCDYLIQSTQITAHTQMDTIEIFFMCLCIEYSH